MALQIHYCREADQAAFALPLSQALEPSSRPMGMSIAMQARSRGRLSRSAGRSTTSTEVASDGSSTAKLTHPARHPSTPATNMREHYTKREFWAISTGREHSSSSLTTWLIRELIG